MTREEAQKLVEAELERVKDKYRPVDCVVLEESTIEKPWGWVFFYQNKKYLHTGDFRQMLGGNAPYIVNKITGQLSVTGTVHNIEHCIKEYESTLSHNT